MSTPPLEYHSPASQVAAPREPKLWVVLVLFALWGAGIIGGWQIWPLLKQPGRSPFIELYSILPYGFLVAVGLLVLFRRRMWHLTLGNILTSFILGALCAASAIAWAIANRGWI